MSKKITLKVHPNDLLIAVIEIMKSQSNTTNCVMLDEIIRYTMNTFGFDLYSVFTPDDIIDSGKLYGLNVFYC